MTDKLKREAYYPIVGYYNPGKVRYAAKWDGQRKRCPKAGEYYLSGAIIEAYKAPNDLRSKFYIAVICEVEIVTTVREIARVI